MRRLLPLALAALALAPAAEAAPGFRYGVAAGEMTATSAKLWTRSNELGPVRLFVWPAPRRGMPFVQITLRPTDARDRVLQRVVHGLKPATRYTYLFSTPFRRTEIAAGGTFWTAPGPGANATVRFAITGDADGARNPKTGRPAYNLFQVYGRMAAERNHFNVNLGDTIYSDSEVGGVPPALSVPAKWAKYKQNLGFAHLRNLRRGTGLYSHWDDHEFINDFSRAEHGAGIFARGVAAFTDYAPVTYRPATGLYRTFRWGRHLELFFLEERAFRSAKVRATCNGDLAPTAPQAVRDAFAALVPALATPVPKACLDAIADPARTMLGARQYAAFTRAIK
ncbi:MAG: hypothetical protein HOQ03_02930, partial [Thermoleophilia bacterium]|nr:hypothetical protein [Thermoleophilia bacterium]